MLRQRLLLATPPRRALLPLLRHTTHLRPAVALIGRPVLAPFSPSPSRFIQSPPPSSSLPAVDSISPTAAPPPPKQRSKLARAVIKSLVFCGATTLTVAGLVVAFFIYDATTYKEGVDERDVSVPQLALTPRRGGEKGLPIAELLVDDEDSEAARRLRTKPRLVVLGCGWGSVALLKGLDPEQYHVTVISPTNYFLYTPLLPSATVGTLEVRSLIEPIRTIVGRVKGHFMKASAEVIDFERKLVEVSQTTADGEKRSFYVPYDKLVIGVGSKTRTHGVEGLEHVHFLKNINDARMIRKRVIENLEQACLPTTSDDERKKLLSFVVCGGGPTGVEFAAELFDMLNEDLTLRYPRLLRNEVSVHIVQSRSHILNTYDEALSKYAEARFTRDNIDVLTNSRVARILPDRVVFTQKEGGKTVTKELPFGLCLWSTGVAQTDFAQKIAASLPTQRNQHALETDPHLRLLGAPGDVYAIGDCATVQNRVAERFGTFLKQIAAENGIRDEHDLHLTFSQWRKLVPRIRKRFPQTTEHLRRLDRLFEEYDEDRSGTLDFDELTKLVKEVDKKLTSLPATAQRAHQQGAYLARKLNRLARGEFVDGIAAGDEEAAGWGRPFEYRHLGSLAYVGNAAVFDWPGMPFGGGLIYLYLWRSVYFAQSVSVRTRMLMAMDWTKRALFGRDLMNF